MVKEYSTVCVCVYIALLGSQSSQLDEELEVISIVPVSIAAPDRAC